MQRCILKARAWPLHVNLETSLTPGSSMQVLQETGADLGSQLVLWDVHQRRLLGYGCKPIESLFIRHPATTLGAWIPEQP